MRLVSLVPIAVHLPLATPVKMAGLTIASTHNLLVRATDDRGTVGWGEAVAAPEMTGETLPGMVAAAGWLAARLEGAEVEAPAFSARLTRMIYGNAAAKAATDMAILDLWGRRHGESIAALIGSRRPRARALLMLARADHDGDVADARAKAAEGFRAFKVKVGILGPDRVARDLARAAAVRAALGDDATISADANEGFSRDDAVEFAAGAEAAGLSFIEQLVAGHDLAAMQAVVAATRVPVAADEGVHTLDDIVRHHTLNAAHGGSLKLMKLGGMAALIEAATRADALGMHVNLAGKTAESGIASAATVHAACAVPQLDWDVNVTNATLAADLVRNPVRVVDGAIAPPDGPGLGVAVDEAAVHRFAVRVLA